LEEIAYLVLGHTFERSNTVGDLVVCVSDENEERSRPVH
jgi:hypothetical protein